MLEIGSQGTREEARAYVDSREFSLAGSCIVQYRIEKNLPMRWRTQRNEEVRFYMLNTLERVAAYDAFDERLGATVITGVDISQADCQELRAGQ